MDDNTQQKPATDEPMVHVFDIRLDATPEETARLLNEQCGGVFYVSSALVWPGAGVRVLLRRYAKSGEGSTSASSKREDRAMQFLRDNREMPANQLSAAFKALGFPRGIAWITAKRAEVVRAERAIS